jgi:hypothetical protein
MSYALEEIKGLENQLHLLTERINRLRAAHALETDVSVKMKYEIDIAQAEEERRIAEEKIRQAYNLNTSTGQSILEQALEEFLDIGEHLGPLYLVNCDRRERSEDFWDYFNDFRKQSKHFQFYFITACETQMPHSFSERMIYELREEEDLNSDDRAILIDADGDRVKMEKLPMGQTLEKSQELFKIYLSNRLESEEKDLFDEKGLPQIGAAYVATIFFIPDDLWEKRFLSDYLAWILRSFTKTREQQATFLFYFAFFVDGIHESISEKQQKLLDMLEKLVSEHAGTCIIKNFLPVTQKDLDRWLRDLQKNPDPEERENLIHAFQKSLNTIKQERFRRDGLIDMTSVMHFQKLIYDWYHRKNSSSSL